LIVRLAEMEPHSPAVTWMLALRLDGTADVETLKVAVVAPAGTVIEAGPVSPVARAMVTPRPPAGAAPVKVTVAVIPLPPSTVVTDKVSDCTQGGLMTTFVVTLLVLWAVMVTFAAAPTGKVPTLKLADVWPAETSRLAGSVNEGELLDSVTVAPPAGAGAASVTCPVKETPPVTLERFTETPDRFTFCGPLGFTVKLTETELDNEAVMVALIVEAGFVVVIPKVAEIWPAAMNTDDGQTTAGLLLDNATVAPLAGAANGRRTVPEVEAPPASVVVAAVTCRTRGVCRSMIEVTTPHGDALVAVAEAPMKLISAFTLRLMGAEVWPAAIVTEPRLVAFAASCTV